MSNSVLSSLVRRLSDIASVQDTSSASDLGAIQINGVRLLMFGAWVSLLTLVVSGLVIKADDLLMAVMLDLALIAIPTGMAWQGRHDQVAQLSVAVAVSLQPGLFLFVFTGHPWQMDLHMYFFAALGALVILCDWRPLAMATMLVAVHHLLVQLTRPQWVFEGQGNFGRVVVHAAILLLQFAFLAYAARRLQSLVAAQQAARISGQILLEESRAATQSAEAARAAAEQALIAQAKAERDAERERYSRIAAATVSEAERNAQMLALAERFEDSVAGVVRSVLAASAELATTSGDLNRLAIEAGRETSDVSQTAQGLTTGSRSVAAQMTTLTRSVTMIVESATRQSELAATARRSSEAGDDSLNALTEQTTDIVAFVDIIADIAARTNLLALNASIEAARAGDAGRGFAVVAEEVKHLAGQAQSATKQITALVRSVDSRAGAVESALNDVAAVIAKLAEQSDGIVSAIDDQRGIFHQIGYHATGTAEDAGDMASRIGQVARSMDAAGALSTNVQGAAQRLADDARGLQEATDIFVRHLRAA